MHKIIISPVFCLGFGYAYILILIVVLNYFKFFNNHSFFSWGPPLILLGNNIDDTTQFYCILNLYFFHQLINNWVNNVTYPWIINNVQDPKCQDIEYSTKSTLLIINMFSLYSELDILFIVVGASSQISFFLAIIIANIISTTIINFYHIKNKNNYINIC